MNRRSTIAGLIILQTSVVFGEVKNSAARQDRRPQPMLVGQIERPLRYTPDGGDFVIINGAEFFNRPLYGGSSPFRVDAGDRPEFSFYLPGHGGNLRIGLISAGGVKWLHEAAHVEARYRGGSMVYEIGDPFLGSGKLQITALSPKEDEGLLLKIDTTKLATTVDLFFAFGGINGARGSRDGDIGCERVPVSDFFKLKPSDCRDNEVTIGQDSFAVHAKAGSVTGTFPSETRLHLADANSWNDMSRLIADQPGTTQLPIACAQMTLVPKQTRFVALQHRRAQTPEKEEDAAWSYRSLPDRFAREDESRRAIAERVVIHTPDPYLDAAMPALNIAADAVWDDRKSAFVHGAVAWRKPLLGWRVGYSGDVLGWHDRTRTHFDSYAARQNQTEVAQSIPSPEASSNLARNENALHSNGDMTQSHYDMNAVGVDVFFRHLLWTGDLEYARRQWPVIERHLAWERRLFRREFGPDKLPLYEAYCCIWASDDLTYHGGGATHSSAYNLYHNRMAARVAKRLGYDASLYENEARLLEAGMQQQLWLADRGWFAEWKDLLGLQLLHPEAGAWTFYHAVDSGAPSPMQAWQMSRFVDTRLPHIPLLGPRVPAGNSTIATTSWMPYTWSLNNVVLAETAHTSLALWQSGRSESAYPLLKGALLDSMYLGICPGNVGMCTWFDANRRESQRDFGDGIGTLSRAIVEGLFGITPDLLAKELKINPGFPADWNTASLHHPDFDLAMTRDQKTESYTIETRFPTLITPRLCLPALRDQIASVTVNGVAVKWQVIGDSVGIPRIEILGNSEPKQVIVIQWSGKAPTPAPHEITIAAGADISVDAGAVIGKLTDPQGTLSQTHHDSQMIHGVVTGKVGHRTLFAQVTQGALQWWQPVTFDVREPTPTAPQVFTTNWDQQLDRHSKLDPVSLEKTFNDRVSQIFENTYLTPRSPYVSLALPKQGYGSWCKPSATFAVDDGGLRAAAAKNGGKIVLPNGVPLVTPDKVTAPNIAFVSQWDNFPRELTVPLTGRASKIFLMMAGSTWAMQSRIDNGEIMVTYSDGSTTRLALENPTTWWPIDQDYFIDDFAFARPGPLPLRVDLKTGKIRILDANQFKGSGGTIPGGAATVLDLSLDPHKEIKSLTVRALANEVIIGLMSATLLRP